MRVIADEIESASRRSVLSAEPARDKDDGQPRIRNLELNDPAPRSSMSLTSELQSLRLEVCRELFGCPDLRQVLQLAFEGGDRRAFPVPTEQAPLLGHGLAAPQRCPCDDKGV